MDLQCFVLNTKCRWILSVNMKHSRFFCFTLTLPTSHNGRGLWASIFRSRSPALRVTLHSLWAVRECESECFEPFNLDIPAVSGEWYQADREEARRKKCKLGKRKKRGNSVVIWMRPRLILWLAEGTSQSSWHAMIRCAILGNIFSHTSLFTSPPPRLPPLLLSLTSSLSLP